MQEMLQNAEEMRMQPGVSKKCITRMVGPGGMLSVYKNPYLAEQLSGNYYYYYYDDDDDDDNDSSYYYYNPKAEKADKRSKEEATSIGACAAAAGPQEPMLGGVCATQHLTIPWEADEDLAGV